MNRVKELRKQKHITQEELGKVLDIQKAAISKYENGRAEPSAEVLKKMSAYFGVSIDYLLGNSTSKEIPDSNLPSLTPKDERDIARDLENMIESLDGSAAMGSTEDDEDRELLRASLETAMKIAKRTAKKKFTPKKYLK
ncbi:XRE family transcriptional regulator [Megasphaera sp. BL7]|uniref:helix-turn-helix domain-containing protein n=1 Tax=unclassified Megasphaera TaxID=2626256 RepID=UPI000357B095|nr:MULTISPECIES: helix-turn-helix domain-containing protein [unclassified Megasphaera]EPP15836.1 XRE family transcriptional regulator [Megasphaera sp. BL7]EPP18964.1 XRE family transcriptional regulator [Megasphaera sp. NM10]